jgi:hypothetical protein
MLQGVEDGQRSFDLADHAPLSGLVSRDLAPIDGA